MVRLAQFLEPAGKTEQDPENDVHLCPAKEVDVHRPNHDEEAGHQGHADTTDYRVARARTSYRSARSYPQQPDEGDETRQTRLFGDDEVLVVWDVHPLLSGEPG